MAPGVNLVEPGSNGTAESLEPCLVSAAAAEAADATGTWVVLVHAPGENRTGNNYWLVQASRALAAAGIPSVRFDLSGHGESLGPKDAARWLAQADAAVALAAARGATRVLLVARGLYCAQLDTAGAQASGLEVLRVALFPLRATPWPGWPDAAAVRRPPTSRPTLPSRPRPPSGRPVGPSRTSSAAASTRASCSTG